MSSAPAQGGGTRIVFLGGVGEVGRNMTVFERDGRIIILDVGLMFPNEEMLGVDLVLPDFEYLRDKIDRIEGVVITHGHEDHIGGLPYLLREMNPPIYAGKLTLGLLRPKLEEHGLLADADLHEVSPDAPLKLGPFELRFNYVAHSIPDALATLITTKDGRILHTGDFKIDDPSSSKPAAVLESLTKDGVDLMLGDSTNADRPGKTPAEHLVGDAIAEVIEAAKGRVIVACFASSIFRVQQIITAAEQAGRLVTVLGRSMLTNLRVAGDLGFLSYGEATIVPIEEAERVPDERLLILSTGSQGEPMSALSLMAARDHKWIELTAGDTVVISATPIPGNEAAVRRVIDGLWRIGCEVIHPPGHPVHVSGHAAAEDLKAILREIKPKAFIPVHGEYRQLALHVRHAHEAGVSPDRTFICEDGDVIVLRNGKVKRGQRVHAGYILVDGLGIGDVGDVVLRDRRLLADDGFIVCVVTIDSQTGELLAGPDIISRGFVLEDEATEFLENARAEIRGSLATLAEDEISDWAVVRRSVRRALGKFVWSTTRRRPMILPIVMEV